MGELINYLEYKEKLQKELDEFLAEIEEYANDIGTNLETELTNLDPVEQKYYDYLLKMLDILARWESNENEIQKPKKMQAQNDKEIVGY